MTYHAGIGESLATELGVPVNGPLMVCDRCGMVASAMTKRGDYKAWLREGKNPPGWIAVGSDHPKKHYCKTCKGHLSQ
jgi:hypothetical protein